MDLPFVVGVGQDGGSTARFGPRVGIAATAALYGLYHVGYGMGTREMVFLFGLGLVYGIAYA